MQLQPQWSRRKGSKYSLIYVAVDYDETNEIDDVIIEEITKDDLLGSEEYEFDNSAVFPEDHLNITNELV